MRSPVKLAFARSPAGLFVILAASLFLAEVIVMLLLAALPAMPPLLTNFLDATLLIVLAFPALRAFAFAPLLRQLRAREETEAQLRAANQTLEQRTRELRNESEQRQLARQLEAEKARLVNAQAVAKVGSWETDFATFAISWSEETHRIFETNPATFQLNHQAFLEFVHPDDRAAVDEAFSRSIGQPGTQTIAHRLVMPDGRVKFVEERWQSFSDDQGRPLRAIGTCQDISDRKRAEEALHESEGRFRDLFENATDLIQIVSPDGHFLFVNRAWEKALGYTDEDLSNLTFLNIVDESTKEHCTDAFRRLMNGEDVPDMEAVFVGKQGQRITVEGSVNCRFVGGKPGNTRGIFRDITGRKRAEEALRASQQVIEGIINAIPVRVFWKDKNLVYMGCNAAFARDAGFADPKDIVGKDDYQMGWSDQADLYRGDDRQILERGLSKLLIEEPQTTPEGHTITLLTSKLPLRNSQGEITGVLGTYMDITERKRGEEALRLSEERFRIVAETANDVVYEWDLKDALVWLGKIDEMLGYAPGEFPRTLSGWAAALHPEDLEGVMAAVRAHLEGRAPYATEYRVRRKDGAYRLWSARGAAARTSDGQPIRWIGSITDITERKQAENALRESNEKFHQLADNITDAFWIRSPDMHEVQYVSRAFERIWGRSVESLYANPQQWSDFILPEDRARVMAAFAALTADAPSLDLEYRIVRPGGEVRWVHVRGFKVRDVADKLIRHIGIVTDITERKRSEAELANAHRELLVSSRQAGMAEVATGVLHNVGNVLNSVNVSATLVLEHVRHSKAANLAKVVALFDQHKADLAGFFTHDARGRMLPEYLGTLRETLAAEQVTIVTELNHLRENIGHINEIVAMQQANARTSGVTETIAVPDMIEDALRIKAEELARLGVDLVRDFQARPVISTDRHKVMQILINLVRNAKFACAESGCADKRLTVRTTSNDRGVQIAIIDNGVGIPAENLSRIFNHGFTTRKTGHGFGLHSAALAAKELGGSLAVQSDGPGHGATFTLELPFNPAPPTL